jgi:hypothetical protein
MSAFASDVREVLNVSAAQPGWRALFVEDSDEKVDFTMQLVGWALVRITTRDSDTGDVLPRARTRIEGVVLQGTDVVSVFEYAATSATFGEYLSPDDPDPVPGTGPDGKGKVDKPDGVKGTRGRGRVRS